MHHASRHALSFIATCCLGLSSAAQIVITDAGLEGVNGTVTGTGLGTTLGSLGAWQVSVGSLLSAHPSVSSGIFSGITPPEGTHSVRFAIPAAIGLSQSIRQTLSTQLAANTRYELSVSISTTSTLSLLNSAVFQLRAGNNSLATLSGTSLTSLLSADGTFRRVVLQYESGANPVGGNLGIYFGTSTLAGLSGNVYLDDFRLTSLNTTAVPEPEHYAFTAGLALAGTAWMLRRRQK